MPTELRDCAEDPKILERASDLYAERPIEEEDIAELEALIRPEATAPDGFLLRARGGVPLAT
jgi:hypothetical protein